MSGETPYPWLPEETVRDWLKITDAASDKANLAETMRQAVGDWIEDKRRDLIVTGEDDAQTFAATPRIVQAALLAVGRLYSRYDSASFAEIASVDAAIGGDVDLVRLLGRRRRPVFG